MKNIWRDIFIQQIMELSYYKPIFYSFNKYLFNIYHVQALCLVLYQQKEIATVIERCLI